MSDLINIIESKYERSPFWHNIVKKLTIRQAYVFYYSLAYYKKNAIAISLGILDFPDSTVVHRQLMDAFQKEDKPEEVARTIADNAHKILINDNDLLWVKTELRAAIWLGYFITTTDNLEYALLLNCLRSTSETEFTNRLIHVVDIYGCGLREGTAVKIRKMFDGSSQHILDNRQSSVINNHRGNYVSNRIDDHHLNWLNKLPLSEIDTILERFKSEEILVLIGTFVPISKNDKIALIKASLDIHNYRYRIAVNNKALLTSHNDNVGNIIKLPDDEVVPEDNDRKKKQFKTLDANQVIDLLKKARNAREHRKSISSTKNNRSLTLNKEAYSTLVKLSDQLNATPKKVVEALIKNIDLENVFEASEIDRLISGRRSIEKNLSLEK